MRVKDVLVEEDYYTSAQAVRILKAADRYIRGCRR
jgi:hypothetical protein